MMFNGITRRIGARVLLPVLFPVLIHAQEFRATITGRVTDASGGGVPDAKITAVNSKTNETAAATTGADGDYTIPLLKPRFVQPES